MAHQQIGVMLGSRSWALVTRTASMIDRLPADAIESLVRIHQEIEQAALPFPRQRAERTHRVSMSAYPNNRFLRRAQRPRTGVGGQRISKGRLFGIPE